MPGLVSRILEGGHHIPDDIVLRRFHAGVCNFEDKYKVVVDEWSLFDNSGELPVLIDKEGQSKSE